MTAWLTVAILSFIALTPTSSIWIGEEYWTTIHYNGAIERGRSEADFVHFKNVRNYDPLDEFVAYLIVNDNRGHYEIYGEAFKENGRVCARFIQREGHSEKTCGGFRVLSRGRHDGVNPFEWHATSRVDRPRAVEYLSHEIARVYTKNKVASIFGGVDLDQGTAYAIDPNGTVIRLTRRTDPSFYDHNIEVLTVKRGYEPPQYRPIYRPEYRPPPVYVPRPTLAPIDPNNLPRIYTNNDPQRIPDADDWYRNHPHEQPRPYEGGHVYNGRNDPYRYPYDSNRVAGYDAYDRNQDGRLDTEEIRARDQHLAYIEAQRRAAERQERDTAEEEEPEQREQPEDNVDDNVDNADNVDNVDDNDNAERDALFF